MHFVCTQTCTLHIFLSVTQYHPSLTKFLLQNKFGLVAVYSLHKMYMLCKMSMLIVFQKAKSFTIGLSYPNSWLVYFASDTMNHC